MNKTYPEKEMGLEGLRALSILGVFLFHFFKPFFDPQGQRKEVFAIFQFGQYGVQLFFLISGYVIASSLSRHDSFRSFIRSRFLRLFPALLFLHIVLLFITLWTKNSEIKSSELIEILLSVTLVDPNFIELWTNVNLSWTTGVLWSLSVEVFFYSISAIGFYLLKIRSHYFVSLTVLAFTVIHFSIPLLDSDSLFNVLEKFFWGSYVLYLPWFALGSIVYELSKLKQIGAVDLFLPAILLSFLAYSMTRSPDFQGTIRQICLLLLPSILMFLFWQSLHGSYFKTLIQARPFLFLGGLSYEFYLVHEIVIQYISTYLDLGLNDLTNVSTPSHILFGFLSLFFSIVLALLLRSASMKLKEWLIHT